MRLALVIVAAMLAAAAPASAHRLDLDFRGQAIVPTGTWAKWDRERLAQTGGSPEQYKHPCLIGDMKFRESMTVLRETC